jgi:hypothetical protein
MVCVLMARLFQPQIIPAVWVPWSCVSDISLISLDSKEMVIELNGEDIEAFPAHLDVTRGLPNASFTLLNGADFFPPGQQQDVRDVSGRYE